MKAGASLMDDFVERTGRDDHIPAEPGDYMGPEGLLHCGKCRESKEYFLKPFHRYVPSLCACGRMERDEFERRQREAAEMDAVEQLNKYSIMDAKQKAARFETAEITQSVAEAYTTAKNYVRRFDEIMRSKDDMKGLMLYGPVGTGKSYLAACIANALMAKRVPVLYTSIIKLTGWSSDDLSDLMDKMRRARLLILDDLGAERGTDFKLEQVFAVIDSRLNSNKPLIVTTNMTLEQMVGSGDLRYSRIWERVRTMCYPILMRGANWRQDRSDKAKAEFMRILKK